MALSRIARSLALNMAGSAAGLLATLLIVWQFGLTHFANYTINVAKLSVILFTTELVPSAYALFRAQEDREFEEALPSFFALAAVAGGVAAWAIIALGAMEEASWLMIAFVVLSTTQNYMNIQTQANGAVGAFYWVPPISNGVRLLLLLALSAATAVSVPNVLWVSLVGGMAVAQAWLLLRYRELFLRIFRVSTDSIRFLWGTRGTYYRYYPSAILKRARDTFLPLFCDIAPIDKAEAGRFFVFAKALEAVCAQLRVLESFLINRAIRARLHHARAVIFWASTLLGHAAVIVLSLVLMYRHGIDWSIVALAGFMGLFVYPYVFELLRRSDAYAAYEPRRVTISMTAFLIGMAATVLVALALDAVDVVTLILAYVTGQILAAATYLVPLGRRAPATKETAK